MASMVRTVMLKQGLPTVAEARARLKSEIDQARRAGIRALKIIHGYGSSGVGGALQGAIRASLRKRVKEGLIQAYVPGEKWDPFDEGTRTAIDQCPELGRDPELRHYNEGITIVVL